MHNTTQLFLIPLAWPRCKIEDLYGNSGIHHTKFIGWVSPFRWLGVTWYQRYQVFACPLSFGTEGQAAPGRVTTSPYKLLLPGAPQAPKEQVKTVVVISHSRSEPSPCLHSHPVLHRKDEAAGSAPYRPRASPLMATSRPFLEWDAPQHGAGGQTQTLHAYLDGGTSGFTHQTVTDATCLLSQRQTDVTPRGLHGGTQLPRQQHLRSQRCRSHHVSPKAFWGYSHEQGPMEPGQLLTQGVVTGGFAEKVSPQLSLTFNLIQTHECLSHCLKVSVFQYT